MMLEIVCDRILCSLNREDDKYSRRNRYDGPLTEFKEKAGYKPEVKLEYMGDDGKMLSTKEAFRHLSHKFHGKGSGKLKSEKRAKKQEDKMVSGAFGAQMARLFFEMVI